MSKKIILHFILLFLLLSCSKKENQPIKSSSKSIITFTFNSFSTPIKTSIDNVQKTVYVNLPVGSDASNLSPTIIISNNATISPASGVIQDFTKPVSYTITAEDGSISNYTIYVIVTKSSEKNIKSFVISNLTPNINAKIDTINKIIEASVPIGSDLAKLTTKITISDKASINPPSGLQQDFSKQISYIITAEDGTTQRYMTKIIEDCYDKNLTLNVFDENIKTNAFEVYPTLSFNQVYFRVFYFETGRQSYKYELWISTYKDKIAELKVGTKILISNDSYFVNDLDYVSDLNDSPFQVYDVEGTMLITDISENLISANLSLSAKNRKKATDEIIIKGCLKNVQLIKR